MNAHVLGLAVLVGLTASIAHAQNAAPPRLPQDAPRAPEPASRVLPLRLGQDAPAEEVPAGAEAIVFRLQAIELGGNTAVPTAELEPLWRDRLQQQVRLTEVFEIAQRIGAAYREHGYVLSQAIVPQQDIDPASGRVLIRVLEGRVSRITVSGAVPGLGHVRSLAAPIAAEQPLTLGTLERSLLLINDLPGVQARANLQAAAEPGAAEMEIVVAQDRSAYSASLHNRTSEALGPVRLELSAERRGLIGAFDRHVLRWVGSGSRRLSLLAYAGDAPLGSSGLQASWTLSASRSEPKSGVPFELDTDSDAATVGLAYPLWRSRESNVALRAGLAAYNGSSDAFGSLSLSRDRLRSLRIGLSADHTDRWGGINLADVELSKGLTGLGASEADDPLLQRPGSEPGYRKATLYLARLQSLGGRWSLLVAATAQHSNSLLASAEQFGLGGELFLRAYDPSELLGDKGAAAKLELRCNVALGPLATTLYAYHDAGYVKLNGDPASKQSALSTGVGVRFGLAGGAATGLRGFVELAKPNNHPVASEGSEKARVFAGLAYEL